MIAIEAHAAYCNARLPVWLASLLKSAEELAIQKALKTEYGGGMKEYDDSDRQLFEGSLHGSKASAQHC